MAKVQKTRATAAQMDQALLEEIAHARNLNVAVNMVSNAAMFALMVRKRLFGDVKMQPGAAAVVSKLMEDSKLERAQHRLQEQEQARQDQSRILVPGDPRFNPRGN